MNDEQPNFKNFPLEIFYPITGETFFLGRVIVNKINQQFVSEIDIVQKDSFKILTHVGTLYLQSDDPQEALDLATQKLSTYLKNGKR